MGYYNSFVVRIWSDEEGRTRGTVEHVASREQLVFLSPEAILAFIRDHLGPPTTEPLGSAELPRDDPGVNGC